MKIVSLLLALLLLSACESMPHEYDPDAVQANGIVTAKQDTGVGKPRSCYSDTIPVLIPGVALLSVPTGGSSCETFPFAYQVKLEGGGELEVLSMFPSFEVGECVKVFISTKVPARIGDGGQCSDEKS